MNTIYKLLIFSSISNKYQELDIEQTEMKNIYSIENIQDITKRNDNITQELKLKGTQKNNIAFGNLYNISRYSDDTYNEDLAYNFKANQKVRCILLENNVQIIKGYLLITSIEINENIIYNTLIQGASFSFFNNLKDRELSDLDSINENITYNFGNIQDSWLNSRITNSSYVYPSIDYGVDERVTPNFYDNSFDYKNFRPAIKLKTYLQAIFKGFRFNQLTNKWTQLKDDNTPLNQYNLTSSLLSDSNFNRLIIPYDRDNLTSDKSGIWANITQSASSFDGGTVGRVRVFGNVQFTGFPTAYFTNVTHTQAWGYDSYYTSSLQSNVNVLFANEPTLKTTLKITFSITLHTLGEYVIGLADTNDGILIDENKIVYNQVINKTTNSAETFQINIVKENEVEFGGKYVMVILKKGGQQGIKYEATPVNIQLGRTNSITKLPLIDNQIVKLNEFIPLGIKLTDFLKSIMTIFNLFLIEDPNKENHFILQTYDEFYEDVINLNRLNALDWTNKIDYTSYSINTNINLPKRYEYKYDEDNDVLNEFYKNRYSKGYGELTINDSKGYAENKEIKVIFAPTINLSHSNNPKSLPILYKADGLLQGQKKQYKSKIRLLYFNGEKPTNTYDVHYRGTTFQSLNRYGHTSMLRINSNNEVLDSLFFDLPNEYFSQDITSNENITLFNKYHSNQLMTLIDDNLITAEFTANLNESDISNMSFKKPIFIQTQYGNAYFKLLEVIYTNSNLPSKIKVMKII